MGREYLRSDLFCYTLSIRAQALKEREQDMTVYTVTLTANNTPTLLRGQTHTNRIGAEQELKQFGSAHEFVKECLTLEKMDLSEYLEYIGAEKTDMPIEWAWTITEER